MDEAARVGLSETAKGAQCEAESRNPVDDSSGSDKAVQQYRLRGKLYDKIKVSLRTMDIIIYVLVALLVIALVVGIVLGN